MLYFKDTNNNTYTLDGHAAFKNDVSSYSYHIPYTAQNFAASLGLKLQEITIAGFVKNRTDLPFDRIAQISFDNWATYQTVYLNIGPDFQTVPVGFYIPFTLTLIASPLRLGTSHVSGDLWGLTSTSLTQTGNYKGYPKITYYAPRFYFPLTQNLIDFAGSSITFTNANSKTYGGVSYSANTPIFDEGLLITSNDVATLSISNYTSGTLLLKIKYKGQNTGSPRTILKNSNFELWLDKINQTINLTQGGNTLSVKYVNDGYENGIMHLIGVKWNATNTYLAVAQWDSVNLTFDTNSLQTTNGAFTLAFGSTYIGSNGPSQWLGDSIQDFILYDYNIF